MSLATKYRPKTFAEIVEQSITTKILEKQLTNKTFKNAYGFFGNSGCGKTTAARAFANAINNNIGDPIEVDAGSLGGVDNIKSLLESAKQRALLGEYKVIIIDECQNLGGGKKENNPAWAALLKTLEECPKYTIFILCSTNPEKIPEAILNRVQRYNFTPISQQGIKQRLEYICQQEGFINYEKTCELISKAVNGGMRDAITYLEQIADFSTNLDIEVTKHLFSGLSYETMFKLTWALQNKEEKNIISIIDQLFKDGQDLKQFINLYFDFIVDLTKYILFKDINVTSIPDYLASAENSVVQFTVQAEDSLDYFNNLAEMLLDLKALIKNDNTFKSTIIISFIKFIRG